MCNSIEDPAALVDAQLSNQQPTYKQLIRRSNGATPTHGSVHLVATLDAARIDGCRVQSAVLTAGAVSPTKIGICTFADDALPGLLACVEISQARRTDKLARVFAAVSRRTKEAFPFSIPLLHDPRLQLT